MQEKEGVEKTMELKNIDPAFDVMKEFSKATNGTVGHIDKMRHSSIFTDGVIPSKHKALAAALWSVSSKCEQCFKFYILKAKELGATKEEVGEFLAIASTMGGCVGEMWALKAFKVYLDNEDLDGSCCT